MANEDYPSLEVTRQAIIDMLVKHQVVGAREAVDRLIAAVRAEQQWQPIETAPKDGTLILGWNGSILLIWFVDIGRGPRWVNAETAYEFDHDRQPTHWMPLPSPPQESS